MEDDVQRRLTERDPEVIDSLSRNVQDTCCLQAQNCMDLTRRSGLITQLGPKWKEARSVSSMKGSFQPHPHTHSRLGGPFSNTHEV